MNEKYIGFDPSLNSFGYCIIETKTSGYILNTYAGTIKTKNSRNIFKSFKIVQDLEDLQLFEHSRFVGIEHYHYKAYSSNIYELGELGGLIRYQCYKKKTSLVEVPPSQVKEFATGNGLASKETVQAAACKFLKSFEIIQKFRNSDESDAFWLALIGLCLHKLEAKDFALNLTRTQWNVLWHIKLNWEVQCPQAATHPHPMFYLVRQNQRNRSSTRSSRGDKLKL